MNLTPLDCLQIRIQSIIVLQQHWLNHCIVFCCTRITCCPAYRARIQLLKDSNAWLIRLDKLIFSRVIRPSKEVKYGIEALASSIAGMRVTNRRTRFFDWEGMYPQRPKYYFRLSLRKLVCNSQGHVLRLQGLNSEYRQRP